MAQFNAFEEAIDFSFWREVCEEHGTPRSYRRGECFIRTGEISFGVAPAMMLLNVSLEYSDTPWLCYSALLIPVAGALRLAKFNNDTEQATTFRGLPIPANAIFWIGTCSWIETYGYPGTAIVVILAVLLSLAMTMPPPAIFRPRPPERPRRSSTLFDERRPSSLIIN